MYLEGGDAHKERKSQIVEDAMIPMWDEKIGVQRVNTKKVVRVDKW
jgi:hypothetical protein